MADREDIQLQFGRSKCAKPGCSGRRKDHKLLCPDCWKKLPDRLKAPILKAFADSKMAELTDPLKAAVAWLEEDEQNPTLF